MSDEQESYKLACMEVWGGNGRVARPVELPGLAGWVYSAPLKSATGGGDIHYLSVCNGGLLSRVALADVMGHGQLVSSLAGKPRELMHKHINTWEQSTFVRELNHAFQLETTAEEYATFVVLGFHRQKSQVVYTNAGHPTPLWYHRAEKKWGLLEENTPHAKTEVGGLPLGLISGTGYSQTTVQLTPGDLLVLYTDGLTEAADKTGEELGSERFLELAHALPVDSPAAAGEALLAAVHMFRDGTPASDDETLMVLQRLGK